MARRLGDILQERGWIDADALDRALADQKGGRGRLGTLLLGRGLVSRDQLGEAFGEQFEVPFRSLTAAQIHPQLPRLLPETFARGRELAPVAVEGDRLTLAMAAPDDMEAISEVELLTGYRVDPVICLADELTAVLDRAFDERVAARQTAVDIRLEELRTGAAAPAAAAQSEDPDAPVVRLVRSILMGAVHSGASDIHLEPHDPQMRVRYRVDGQLQEIMTVPGHSEEAVVGRIKVMADMDTAERRRPQDGTLTLIDRSGSDGEQRASFRVSSIPTVGGEKVVMRVLDETGRTFSFDALGMPGDQADRVRRLLDKPHGMVVMTGPTGSGKTTTMYSMLCSIDSDLRNISTIEDPVEFRLPGVNQVQANNEFGMGFANGLKYLMRQDPDVILVGEIRDRETASAAVQAALTGHLLISTLHTNDAVGTVARLADLGLDQFKIAGSLIASIGQRLLRRICPHCRRECAGNRKLIETLFAGREPPADVDPGAVYYEGAGCERCHGTGYAGRTPIYEIMTVTPAMGRAIESGAPSSKLRELAAADGTVELAVGGLRQARAGVTTIDEVYFKLAG